MGRIGWGTGLGLATLVSLAVGIGLASRASRVAAWDIEDPEWWGDAPYVTAPDRG